MTYHSSPVSIGSKQERTPEGFLVCKDVRVARVGEQWYMPGELRRHDGGTIDAGPDGVIRVERPEEEVFAPSAIASANGKPVTLNHPPEFVTPKNARQYVAGTMVNPRKGEGDDAGFLVADLIVTHDAAIRQIQDGKRGVSLGYDAKYQNVAPGRERQHSILINHVALVLQGKPRCGPMCSIGDSDMSGGKGFGASVKQFLSGKLTAEEQAELDAAATRDAAALTVDAKIDGLSAEIKALPSAIAAEIAKALKPAAQTTDSKPSLTADAATAGTALQDTIGKAYILAPTFKPAAMTVDAMGDPAAVRTHDCNCKRGALKSAMALDANKAIFGALVPAGANVDTMDAAQIETVFAAAAEAKRLANNAVFAQAATAAVAPTQDGRPMTPSEAVREMNEKAAKKYARTGVN